MSTKQVLFWFRALEKKNKNKVEFHGKLVSAKAPGPYEFTNGFKKPIYSVAPCDEKQVYRKDKAL